jgi:hypothetical protein
MHKDNKEACHAIKKTQRVSEQPIGEIRHHCPFHGIHGTGNCAVCAHSGNGAGQDRYRLHRRQMAMAVLPASYSIDFDDLRKETGAKKVELASEAQFKDMFPECEIGIVPPFGNLYGMDVYVDEHLTRNKEIAFNAGGHLELYRMSYRDFEELVKPKVLKFT